MNQKNLKNISSFRRISLITAIAVYFLILVGGIVRSTGSGMGCPDWPKCFGSYVPPTDVSQLPDDYQEVYLNKRLEKNERFVQLLHSLGFDQKAEEIKQDKSILVEGEFNVTKTWIEYLNRLVGAVIGLLVIATLIASYKLIKEDKWLFILSFANLILVIFQGWIGSIVVSTNLLQWMITVHMLLALLIVCLLLYVHYRAYKLKTDIKSTVTNSQSLFRMMLVGFVLMTLQVVWGTQVREEIDIIAMQFGDLFRDEWISHLGIDFLIHRSFSLILLGIHIWFIYRVYQQTIRGAGVLKWSQVLVLLIFLEILSGVGMAYFGIPAYLQPVHLLVGSLIIGVQFVIMLLLWDQKRVEFNTSKS
ncbi:cytochrome oxidase assembly protein [Echinicola pacifica]|uniref:Cytochrome oxidase assembly protein n=1 Tax=Echinicola pacifica TaxID=346377 RepID=A0A918Q082_9BACT|nr:COX15/CtaA family protein [Echinicola pacifica]GGZ28230.1 cytochrome oxidase assembly protein [Echinicola pacifica]